MSIETASGIHVTGYDQRVYIFISEDVGYRVDIFARCLITELGFLVIATKGALTLTASILSFNTLQYMTGSLSTDVALHDFRISYVFFYAGLKTFFYGMKDPFFFQERENPDVGDYAIGVLEWMVFRPYHNIEPETLY